MDRLERIRSAAQSRDSKKDAEKQRIAQLVAERMAKVKALAPRFNDLMSIAAELKGNHFTLGKLVPVGGCGFLYEQFVSNGIDHRIGFFKHHATIIGFGIQGGGCNGDDVVWDINGDYIQHLSEDKWDDYKIRQKLDKFIDGFDGFERRFNEYVDNL